VNGIIPCYMGMTNPYSYHYYIYHAWYNLYTNTTLVTRTCGSCSLWNNKNGTTIWIFFSHLEFGIPTWFRVWWLLRDFEHMLCCREIKTLVENFRTTPHKIQNNLFKKRKGGEGVHLFTPPWMDGCVSSMLITLFWVVDFWWLPFFFFLFFFNDSNTFLNMVRLPLEALGLWAPYG
jgi:hypothetical protein